MCWSFWILLNSMAAAAAADGLNAGDWKDLDVRSLPLRWDFEENDLPSGWVRTGWATTEAGWLVVGDSKDEIDVACTPLVGLSGPLKIRLHWSADIPSYEPPTWSVVEVRAMHENGTPYPETESTRFFAARSSHMPITESAEWLAPEGVKLARVCIKTGGAALGTSRVDWLELAVGSSTP
jgi:hypothetical protein